MGSYVSAVVGWPPREDGRPGFACIYPEEAHGGAEPVRHRCARGRCYHPADTYAPFSKPRANPDVFTLKGNPDPWELLVHGYRVWGLQLENRSGTGRAASRMPVLGAVSRSDGRFYGCVTAIKETNPHTQSIQTEPILIVCAAQLDGLQNLTNFIRAPPAPAWAPHRAPRGMLLHLCSGAHGHRLTEDPTWLLFMEDLLPGDLISIYCAGDQNQEILYYVTVHF